MARLFRSPPGGQYWPTPMPNTVAIRSSCFTATSRIGTRPKVIGSTVRDATFVLDGLLEHGTDIRIEEHYTDTGGVTEQIFALCHLLGFRFAPRIRDLPDRRLLTFRNPKQYGALKDLIADQVDEDLIQRNWDDVLRLASSIREGKVSASLLVSKLAAYPRHSEVALALREVGRIERTLFTLDW